LTTDPHVPNEEEQPLNLSQVGGDVARASVCLVISGVAAAGGSPSFAKAVSS
jgi:hypothetical protein